MKLGSPTGTVVVVVSPPTMVLVVVDGGLVVVVNDGLVVVVDGPAVVVVVTPPAVVVVTPPAVVVVGSTFPFAAKAVPSAVSAPPPAGLTWQAPQVAAPGWTYVARAVAGVVAANTAKAKAKATITSATMRIDIFFIVTSSVFFA